MREPHALAAAAGRGLHHHRIADLAGDLHCLIAVGNRLRMAGNDIDAGLLGQFLGFDLVAHRRDGLRRRANEQDIIIGTEPREALPLGEEAIAGMHGVRAGRLAGLDDLSASK